MFAKLQFIVLSLILCFGLISCGANKLKPSDQAVTDAVLVEALGAFFDANPSYKAKVVKIVTDGTDLLNGKTVVTRAGVIGWIKDQVASSVGDVGSDKHLKRVMGILLDAYLPTWDQTTLNFINADDKALLLHLADIVLIAAQ